MNRPGPQVYNEIFVTVVDFDRYRFTRSQYRENGTTYRLAKRNGNGWLEWHSAEGTFRNRA